MHFQALLLLHPNPSKAHGHGWTLWMSLVLSLGKAGARSSPADLGCSAAGAPSSCEEAALIVHLVDDKIDG